MLIQIPVFLAFYWVLLESVEMRQAPFLGWISDLSARDPFFILPVIMAGAMFVQFKLNPQMGDPMQEKMFMIMPLVMSVTFAFFPSGLVLYWVTNTVLSILQQWNINRRIAAQAAQGAALSASRRDATPSSPPRRRRAAAASASCASRAAGAAAWRGRCWARCRRRARAALRRFRDAAGAAIDTGLALYFPAPHSYTGEDVLELQGHGGPWCSRLLSARVLALGARRARPGEFTERAFLNGKLDLAQAEAVADLIDAGVRRRARARRCARCRASSRVRVHALRRGAVTGCAPTSRRRSISPTRRSTSWRSTAWRERCADAATRTSPRCWRSAARGALLTEGLTVVIAGRPNAGKSHAAQSPRRPRGRHRQRAARHHARPAAGAHPASTACRCT